MNKIFEKISNPLIFILAAALLRLIPHVPNFAPIGAMALFGGVYLKGKSTFIIPLSAMMLSDVVIGFDSLISRITVYGSFVLIVLVGLWLKDHRNTKNIILSSLAASFLFFVITNSGVWAFSSIYPKTFVGLEECFIAAIPFFRNTLLGDFFYTGVFFGGYALVKALVEREKFTFMPKA